MGRPFIDFKDFDLLEWSENRRICCARHLEQHWGLGIRLGLWVYKMSGHPPWTCSSLAEAVHLKTSESDYIGKVGRLSMIDQTNFYDPMMH